MPSKLKAGRREYEYAKMMDLREAKACLDEYSVSLAMTCALLKPNVAQGERREAIEKLNGSLIETLDVHIREALKLCIVIQRRMNARRERMLDFTSEEADVLVALKQLSLATDMAAEAQAEYLRKAAVNETEMPNRAVEAIREFKRRNPDWAGNVGPKPSDDQRRVPRTEISPVEQTTEESDPGIEKQAVRLPWRPRIK